MHLTMFNRHLSDIEIIPIFLNSVKRSTCEKRIKLLFAMSIFRQKTTLFDYPTYQDIR